jgi:hypothetical protein
MSISVTDASIPKLTADDVTGNELIPLDSGDGSEAQAITIDNLSDYALGHAQKGSIPLPVLLMGGDHGDDAYLHDFHKIALDRGLPWYLAINTGDGDTSVYGDTQTKQPRMMTWAQIKDVEADGVELLSHGTGPHLQSWDRINTGLFIKYTGNGTAADVTIAGTYPSITLTTTVTGSSDGSAGFGALDLTSASYDTLGELVAYINTRTGWAAELDGCLTGSELSNNLLVQSALNLKPTVTIACSGNVATVTLNNHGADTVRNITISGATPSQVNGTYVIQTTPNENTLTYTFGGAPFTGAATGTIASTFDRPLCAGSGIVLRYTGTAYKRVHAVVAPTVLRILGDGVLLTSFTLSSYTIAGLVTAINGASISGLLADRMDARKAGTNATAGVQTYLHGLEASTNLVPQNMIEITGRGALLQCGISRRYMIARRVEKTVERAKANGTNFKHFAESGSEFYPHLASALNGIVGETRGNPRELSILPYAVPMALLPQKWHPVAQLNKAGASGQNYSVQGRVTCLAQAIADSNGFMCDFLIHGITPDGSSGYTIPTPVNTQDLNESDFVAFLDAVKAKKDAGEVAAITVDEFYKYGRCSKKPENYIFNPKFRNSGETLTGLTQVTNGGGGYIVPGVAVNTPAQVTTAQIDANNRFIISSNSASSFQFLTWECLLETGKLYELGSFIEVLGYTSGNVLMAVYAQSYWSDIKGGYNYAKESDPIYRTGDVGMYFTIPPMTEQNAQVISKNSETFNVPTGTSKIKMDGGAYITGINLAGSTPAATTAKEVAAAINAAFAASSAYSDEYKNVAKAISGKVVITSPYAVPNGNSGGITIATDTGTDQITPIFGNTYITGLGSHANVSAGELRVARVMLLCAMNGTFAVSKPFLREATQNI